MKFSVRQILASAAGAVIAAVIASTFGVKGTIVGVAIGSAAATFATALVAQSIERGHEAVKQVVVRAPESSPLLRKLGGTGTGSAGGSPTATSPASTGSTAPGAGAETVEMASSAAPAEETERLEISAVAGAPATQRIDATTLPMQPAGPSEPGGRPAEIQLDDHCRHGGHRVRDRADVHHGHRADLGETAGRDLREQRRRDDGQEHLHAGALALAGTDHDDLDHVDDPLDVDDDLVHDDGDQHDDQHDSADEHHHDGRSRRLDHHDRPERVGRIDDDNIVIGAAIALRSRVTSP